MVYFVVSVCVCVCVWGGGFMRSTSARLSVRLSAIDGDRTCCSVGYIPYTRVQSSGLTAHAVSQPITMT
jgi:hypothetical protein